MLSIDREKLSFTPEVLFNDIRSSYSSISKILVKLILEDLLYPEKIIAKFVK